MDIKHFGELWSQTGPDLEKQKQHWDIRAKEFNNYRDQTAEERITKLIAYLKEKGVEYKNEEVLDIGCGTGRFSLEFARKAKSVTGLDISSEMIKYANENIKRYGITNTQFLELPWEEVDLDTMGWHKKYYLVVAIMAPVITSRESLEKMMAASKGYCFISRYVVRYEEVKTAIEQNILHRENKEMDHGRDIYYCFNILWLSGKYPEITYQITERENIRTVEDAFIYYCAQLEMKHPLTNLEKQAILKYLGKIARNGKVKDTFKSKAAWLFWKNY